MGFKGLKVVTLLISGRPLIINDALDLWLPGTEGAGMADVLFGDYAPTGKLPHTWPASMDQIPLDGTSDTEPLFPFGYGLTY